MKKMGFTLAEVLITLAIIGVVAAMTIPSVIVNTNQQEFKTGLRKAVSVLNSAITMNKALTGESPYDNGDLFNYLQQSMTVSKKNLIYRTDMYNGAFYTTDGMRFEIPLLKKGTKYSYKFRLYETDKVKPRVGYDYGDETENGDAITLVELNSLINGTIDSVLNLKCGSYGLAHNPDGTSRPPCIITVDVNGDRKPSPSGLEKYKQEYNDSYELEGGHLNWPEKDGVVYKKADPNGKLLSDVFSIMITDQGAIPYGVVAQKAMYQAQK